MKTSLVGIYKGYYTSIRMFSNNKTDIIIVINATKKSDLNNIWLRNWLYQNRKRLNNLKEIEVKTNLVKLILYCPINFRNIPNIVNENVNFLINCLIANGYTTCCRYCSSETNKINYYRVNDHYSCFCDDCVSVVKQKLEYDKKNFLNNESNSLKGTIGAILGSLIGIILWIVMYRIDYFDSIAGLVIAYGTLKGYEILSGYLNRRGVLISIIVIIISIWLSNKIAWTLNIYDTLKESYSIIKCFINLNSMLIKLNLKNSYHISLIFGYLIGILGSYKIIYKSLRKTSGKYILKKVNI